MDWKHKALLSIGRWYKRGMLEREGTLHDTESELAALREATRWRKVSDELPEYAETVVLACRHFPNQRDVGELFYDVDDGCDFWMLQNGDHSMMATDFDYWRYPLPLPEA